MTIRSKAKGVEAPAAEIIAAEGRGGVEGGSDGWVWEVWRKEDWEERKGRRTNMRAAILSHDEMEGSRFLLPFSAGVERGWGKRFSEWWLDPLAFVGVPAAGQGPRAMPPWPWGTRALGRREILANRLQKAATKTPENSSQFAVWSLNRDIYIYIYLLTSFFLIKSVQN